MVELLYGKFWQFLKKAEEPPYNPAIHSGIYPKGFQKAGTQVLTPRVSSSIVPQKPEGEWLLSLVH